MVTQSATQMLDRTLLAGLLLMQAGRGVFGR